jgi:arylsulfatase A-like enzyme
MRQLRESGQERDTAVFVCSDNGAHSGEEKGFNLFQSNGKLRGEKTQLYEGGIRVPMIAHWPGHIRAGAASNLPWSFCDFLPTAAEIAGLNPPANIDGISVLPELTGRPQKKHDYLYWEHHRFTAKTGELQLNAMAQAARMGDWKAVSPKPGAPIELYNLREDPSETKDVAAQNSQVVRKMEEILKSAHVKPRPHNTGSMQWVS